MLLQREVEVGAAEPEARHAAPPRVLRPTHPWARLRVEVEGALFDVQARIGSVDLDGRRQRAVHERHDRLEHARRTRRRLGVADLRLHRAQRAPLLLRPLRPEHELQTSELRRVARLRTGAVRLHELHRARRVAGRVVRAPQGPRLPLAHRRVHALAAPVRRGAHALEHGVDAVAVTLRVAEPAQGEHREALTEQRAIGLVGERPAVAGARQRRRLAEAHVHEDAVHHVHAAGEHQIGLAEPQLVGRHAHSGERGRARRVGHAVCTVQIEPVRDAARHDVAEEPGEGRLLPGGVVGGDPVAGRLGLRLGQTRLPQGLEPDRPLQPGHHVAQQLLGAGDAEDDARALPVDVLELPAGGVVERALGDDERHELRGVRGGQDARGQAEAERVEVDVGHERATGRPGAIGLVHVVVEVVLYQPAIFRHPLDEIAPRQDVPPEPALIGRSREDAAHADDRQGLTRCRHAQPRCSAPILSSGALKDDVLENRTHPTPSGRGANRNASGGTGAP